MEKTLWTQIRKKLKNFFIQRVETQIERGIPDVHYVTYGGHCGWIEGKWVKTPKRRKTKIKVNLSIEQLAWHKSYEFYGGKVFILVKKLNESVHIVLTRTQLSYISYIFSLCSYFVNWFDLL